MDMTCGSPRATCPTPVRAVRSPRTDMGCVTWWGTYGSGVSTGLRAGKVPAACIAAVVGASSPSGAGLATATSTILITPSVALASGLFCLLVISELKPEIYRWADLRVGHGRDRARPTRRNCATWKADLRVGRNRNGRFLLVISWRGQALLRGRFRD